ncbi:MAG: hypothetical protein NVS9B4_12720 [Candidatus Acidiferrum sp.]
MNELLEEAQQHIEKSEFAAAVAPLQKVLAEQPDFAYAHFQLAYAFTALKREQEARAEYQRTIAIDPKMAEAQVNLGILLLDREPALAIPPLTAAVQLLPSQSRPRLLLGVAQERSGDMQAAAESFEAAERLDPRDAEALMHLGNLYLRTKRPVEAEAKFRSALNLQSKNSTALLGLAQSLDAQKKPEALEAFRDYFATQSGDAAAQVQFVRLLIAQQRYDDALSALDRAESGRGPALETLRLRADILLAQKKWEGSAAAYRRALILAPRDAQLHGGLGQALLHQRDFAGAQVELNKAFQLDSQNATYLKDLASALYLGGNYPAALAALDQIAKAEPPTAGEWFIRALCYDKLNQFRPALEAYEKFLQSDQNKDANQVWQAQQRVNLLRRKPDQKR